MLTLHEHILVNQIFRQLTLDDILSLRQVSSSLRATIDSLEWDRRYFQDFPFDSVRLAGQGMDRYIKRYKAKVRSAGYTGSNRGLGEGMQFQYMVQLCNHSPIVDIGVFETPGWAENGVDEADEVAGLVLRCFDGNIFLQTESHVQGLLDTSELTQMRISSEGLFLRGMKNGTPIECDLEPFMREQLEFSQPNLLDIEPDLYYVDDDVTKNLKRLERADSRLAIPNPQEFYQDNRNYNVTTHQVPRQPRRQSRSLGMDTLIKALVKTAPGLETLYCPRVWMGAGSRANFVYTIRDENTEGSSAEPDFHIHNFTFGANIVKVGSYYSVSANGQSLLVLDTTGKLYGKWYVATAMSSPLPPTEPQLLYEDVADLVENTILMKDGTVKSFNTQSEMWEDVASHAVLITTSLYLQAR